MFGHHWEPAEATIVLTHAKSTTGDGLVTTSEYIADVRKANAAPFRATIQEPTIATSFWPPRIGDVVSVLVDSKSGKVKFDKDDPRLNAKARMQEQKQRFEATGAQSHGSPAAVRDGSPPLASWGFAGDPEQARAAIEALRAARSSATAEPADRLAKLEALKERGLLTDEEYASQRQRILDAI